MASRLVPQILQPRIEPLNLLPIQTRSIIYYDRNTGKRHTCRDSVKRFFRLRWGGWIRTRAGGKRKLWRKPWYMRWYNRQHILCTEEESKMLERLIAGKYKRARYFIDDIYEPYHQRSEFDVCPEGQLRLSHSYIKMMYR